MTELIEGTVLSKSLIFSRSGYLSIFKCREYSTALYYCLLRDWFNVQIKGGMVTVVINWSSVWVNHEWVELGWKIIDVTISQLQYLMKSNFNISCVVPPVIETTSKYKRPLNMVYDWGVLSDEIISSRFAYGIETEKGYMDFLALYDFYVKVQKDKKLL